MRNTNIPYSISIVNLQLNPIHGSIDFCRWRQGPLQFIIL